MKQSPRSIFDAATKLIPSEENINTRRFILHDNALHFEGDRSWFVIENFIVSENNYILTYSNLEHIFRVPGDIKLEKVDEYTVIATNGRVTASMIVSPVNVLPYDKTIEAELTAMPDTIRNGRKVSGLVTDFTSVFAMPVDDVYAMILHKTTMVGAVIGNDKFTGMLTNELPIMNAAIAMKSDIGIGEGGNLYFKTIFDESDSIISSMVKCRKLEIPDRAVKTVSKVLKDNFDTNTIEISKSELLTAYIAVSNMNANNIVDYSIVGNELILRKRDRTNNKIKAILNITNNLNTDIDFEGWIIDPPMVNFLVSSIIVPKNEEPIIHIKLNPEEKTMTLFSKDSNNNIKSFIYTYMKV